MKPPKNVLGKAEKFFGIITSFIAHKAFLLYIDNTTWKLRVKNLITQIRKQKHEEIT